MKKFVRSYILEISGAAAGGIAGYVYWLFIGCASGQCAITSSPVNSSVYGAVVGGLLFSSFKKSKKEEVL